MIDIKLSQLLFIYENEDNVVMKIWPITNHTVMSVHQQLCTLQG